MDKKEIHARLRSSLELKQLWSYFIITAVILSLFLLFAVWRNPGEGKGIAATVYGLFIAPLSDFLHHPHTQHFPQGGALRLL